jgi:U3 small nucleolar RNA-associated protein 3
MKSNRGLTPKRKKENRNARVKNRNKYKKAMKKMNHMRPGVKDRMNPVLYDGEASGINCNVVKSTKLFGS